MGFGLAIIVTFAIFILNDLIDQTLDYPINMGILNIKLEGCMLVLLTYFLVTFGIFTKSERFELGINFSFS